MTTTTHGHRAADRYGFRTVAPMEWHKLRTIRSTWYVVAGFATGMIGLAMLVLSHENYAQLSAADRASFDPTHDAFLGLLLGQLLFGTLGVLAITTEFSSGMIRATFAAAPRRSVVLAVAAVTAEATALRRLERDIHDGPQQRLVRLAMELGRAQHHLDSRPEAVRAALADAIVQTEEALDELRALSRGIAPPILVDRGLRAALTALAARSTIPVELDADHLDRRLNAAVETAAYFVIAEALTNVAKHSYAGRCAIGLRHNEGTLRVWVTDDGVGGAALDKGHGLRGLDDRLHAVGGRLWISSPHGGPTTITAELPCR